MSEQLRGVVEKPIWIDPSHDLACNTAMRVISQTSATWQCQARTSLQVARDLVHCASAAAGFLLPASHLVVWQLTWQSRKQPIFFARDFVVVKTLGAPKHVNPALQVKTLNSPQEVDLTSLQDS